ncbi:MAG: UbiD family decarboxylase [Desulfotomaculaceae bacterium]|nr:UbiD family decarboxylase [Desulfotomaculaceae bacterium]
MDLKEVIKKLEDAGKVVHIKTEVDLKHELAGFARKFEGKQIVVFDKVKGSDFPVVCGLWWNRDNVAEVFDTNAKELPFIFAEAAKRFETSQIEPIVVENPPCQEVISLEPNLYEIPAPTLALKDGGPYFSNCVVIAKDPDTGVRNTSIHRLQIKAKDRLGLLLDMGRHLRDYYERAEKKGEPLEITINNGVDPAIYVSAIYAGTPITMDELGVASELRNKEPIKLSKSKTVNVEGIAEAQVVIEAEILPEVREPEGPFGEVSGYYAQEDNRWVVRVKAITRRKDPLIHTLLPGKEVWNSVGLCSEPGIFNTVSKQVGGLKNVHLNHGTCGFYGAFIQIDPTRKGMAKNAILSTFAAFPPLNMVVAVNSDVDIFDTEDVMRAIATRCIPEKDIFMVTGSACHELNPSTDNGYGTKLGFDCTVPIPASNKFEKVAFKEVDLNEYDF